MATGVKVNEGGPLCINLMKEIELMKQNMQQDQTYTLIIHIISMNEDEMTGVQTPLTYTSLSVLSLTGGGGGGGGGYIVYTYFSVSTVIVCPGKPCMSRDSPLSKISTSVIKRWF